VFFISAALTLPAIVVSALRGSEDVGRQKEMAGNVSP